jgi:hypothetical protein
LGYSINPEQVTVGAEFGKSFFNSPQIVASLTIVFNALESNLELARTQKKAQFDPTLF